MLSRKKRVDTTLFKELLKEGRFETSGFFTLRYAKGASDSPSRIAVVVSKKVSLLSVERNREKRRISAIIEKLYPQIQKGLIVGIFPKKTAAALRSSDLRREIEALLQKARILP